MHSIDELNQTNTCHTPLSELMPGERAALIAFDGVPVRLRRKLMTMGLLPGCEITCMRCAPWGGPLHICLRNTSLIIRKCDAQHILISKSESPYA